MAETIPMTTSIRGAPEGGAVPNLAGVSALAGDYDGFVLDLWGVIHDGVEPYPGALDCLARLRAAGKATVLLSNAPRRANAMVAGTDAASAVRTASVVHTGYPAPQS